MCDDSAPQPPAQSTVRAWMTWLLAAALLFAGAALAAPATGTGASGAGSDAAATHALIVGVTEDGRPPFTYFSNGKLFGLSPAFLSKALGTAQGNWQTRVFETESEVLRAACRGEIDVVLDLTRTSPGDACLTFSDSYYEGRSVVVTRPDHATLAGSTLAPTATYAVEEGFFMAGELRKRYPDARFLYTRNTTQALQAVADGRADAYVGLLASVQYEMRDPKLRNLVISQSHIEPSGGLRFAFPIRHTALRDAVNEGLQHIDSNERTRLMSQWLLGEVAVPPPQANTFALSPEEQQFLSSLPPLKTIIGTTWAPYSYLDSAGQPTGVIPEYLAYIARMLHIRFIQTRSPLDSPAQDIAMLEAGQIDVSIYALPTTSRESIPGATIPISLYPVAIVGKRTAPVIIGLSQLEGRRVAVVEQLGNEAQLHAEAPGAKAIVVRSPADGLQLVRDGKADAAIGNLAIFDRLLQGDDAGDFKVIGWAGYKQAVGFRFRPGLEPLVPIVNRLLATMPEEQRLAIQNRYLATQYNLGLTWQDVVRRSLPIILLVTLAIAMLAFGYARLRNEVRQRKQTEEDLTNQLRFRQTLLDLVPFPIAVRSAEGRYVDINTGALSAIGLSREQIIGHTIAECAEHLKRPNSLTQSIATRIRAREECDGVLVPYVDTLGEPRHGLYWSRQFLDEHGKQLGTIGVVVDVTPVVNAERKIRETQALLHDITRNLPAALFQLRRTGNGDFSYQYIGGNDELLPDFPLFTLPATRTPHKLVIAPEHMSRLRDAIENSARTMQALFVDVEALEGNTSRWLQISAVPRRDNDGALLWDGYWNDTTREHQRAEELEEARDAAEHASIVKDEFLAMMSHEIRTPMSGVLGLVEILAKGELRGDQAPIVGMIHDSAGALLQILDDILDYSKIQANKLSLESEPFDLRAVCDLVMGLLLARADEKGLTMRCRIDRRVAALHRGDSVRIRQVLFNLLGNSTKFTANGSISLNVEVEGDTGTEQTLRLTVSDTGIGIDEAHIPMLFSPFVQADSSTSRRFGGTGLGLSISNQLTSLMGGSIDIASRQGLGTSVTVRLPLPVEKRHQDDEEQLQHLHAAILISSKEIAAALIDGLGALGVRAETSSPDELETLVNTASPGAPNVVFLDEGVTLPGEPGRFVAIHVTERPKAAGYRLTEDDIRVSANPLSFRGLRAVCHAALGEKIGAYIQRDDSALPAVRSRDEALRDGTLVLVAEDNPVNRHLIQMQLKLLGYASDSVEDGAQALKLYESTRYGILITDCHMPNVNGYALAGEVRERERGKYTNASTSDRLPIIGLTASVQPDERDRCLRAGMDDLLRKPAQIDALRACLLRWLPPCPPTTIARIGNRPAEHELEEKEALPNTNATKSDDAPLPPLDWFAICGRQSAAGRDETLIEISVSSLRDDMQKLNELIKAPDEEALRQWIHRVSGTASFLRYEPISDALANFRPSVTGKSDIPLDAAAKTLIGKLGKIADHLALQ